MRLGGFVHLPRLLDKTRASIVNQLGDYSFPCALDQRVLSFMGIEAEEFISAVRSGKSDSEMLEWILGRLTPARRPPRDRSMVRLVRKRRSRRCATTREFCE